MREDHEGGEGKGECVREEEEGEFVREEHTVGMCEGGAQGDRCVTKKLNFL